jgi:hypothetical protein
MKIVTNAFVNQNGAYYNTGGIIEGTQRILCDNNSQYWQQGNINNTLAIVSPENFTEISEAVYIGRIPTHLGHFIMEGMPRLCDISIINKPIIGYITDGFLPEGIKSLPKNEVKWFINVLNQETFYEINENEFFYVKTLYVPKLPYHLSHSCAEPWRMSTLIKKIVEHCRLKHNNIHTIQKYWLSRYEDIKNDNFVFSNPIEELSLQITKISLADNLYGNIGSNTHLSIFGKTNAKTYWNLDNTFIERTRNQLICDLIRTYNNF